MNLHSLCVARVRVLVAPWLGWVAGAWPVQAWPELWAVSAVSTEGWDPPTAGCMLRLSPQLYTSCTLSCTPSCTPSCTQLYSGTAH